MIELGSVKLNICSQPCTPITSTTTLVVFSVYSTLYSSSTLSIYQSIQTSKPPKGDLMLERLQSLMLTLFTLSFEIDCC